MSASLEFEQQVKRIHALVEQPDSVITWNDHLPDPDNPEQLRQIDISIKKGGTLTLVECRIHKKKQDVKWIEELIGRRLSLQADALIAVSASGFTSGAIKKAATYGIFLRDLLTLSDEEIRQWGNKAKIWVEYVRFSNPKLICVFCDLPKEKINLHDAFTQLISKKDLLYMIFERVSKEIDSNKIPKNEAFIQSNLEIPGLNLVGGLVRQIKFSSQIEIIKEEILTPYVLVYDAPTTPVSERDIKFEKVNFGETQIIQTSNKASILLDFSSIESPPNAYFLQLTLDMNRVVNSHIEAIGLKAPSMLLQDMNLSVAFQQEITV